MKKIILGLFALLFLLSTIKAQDNKDRICGSTGILSKITNPTVENVSNFVGQKHNEFVEKIYLEVKNNQDVLIGDVKKLQDAYKSVSIDFFAPLGITKSSDVLVNDEKVVYDELNFTVTDASTSCKNIVDDLQGIIDNNLTIFSSSTLNELNALKTRAMNLDNLEEAIKLSCGIQTAISSQEYWSQNLQKWNDLSNTTQDQRGPSLFKQLDGRKIVGADIAGAIRGGMGGGLGGPGGVVAGALLLGSGASAVEACLQSFENHGGTVGNAIKWIRSWF